VTYRRKDPYYRRAKAAGYRARSAYKLEELDRRFQLLAPGNRVVDLGAWPGGWLQVALDRVGPTGHVIAIDLEPIEPLAAPNVSLVTGDIRDPDIVAAARAGLGRAADVVLCDVAPKLTGVRATDEARRAELADAVLAALPLLLVQGGRLLLKLFMDAEQKRIVGQLRSCFSQVRLTRPEASRAGSAELYAIASGYRGTPIA